MLQAEGRRVTVLYALEDGDWASSRLQQYLGVPAIDVKVARGGEAKGTAATEEERDEEKSKVGR